MLNFQTVNHQQCLARSVLWTNTVIARRFSKQAESNTKREYDNESDSDSDSDSDDERTERVRKSV